MASTPRLPVPRQWDTLTASGTRYGLLVNLYELIHWDESVSFTSIGTHSLSDYWDFFCEDFMFRDNPESMVGQSLFEDELPLMRSFINVFEPFAEDVPNELLGLPRKEANISLPRSVRERATELYMKLLEKGDPKIEQYLK